MIWGTWKYPLVVASFQKHLHHNNPVLVFSDFLAIILLFLLRQNTNIIQCNIMHQKFVPLTVDLNNESKELAHRVLVLFNNPKISNLVKRLALLFRSIYVLFCA